jgi:hypothetical protein
VGASREPGPVSGPEGGAEVTVPLCTRPLVHAHSEHRARSQEMPGPAR